MIRIGIIGAGATVAIADGIHSRLPVKTTLPIPKDRLANAMAVLAAVRLKAPVSLGDVIIRDLLATGADVVATRNMDKL